MCERKREKILEEGDGIIEIGQETETISRENSNLEKELFLTREKETYKNCVISSSPPETILLIFYNVRDASLNEGKNI